MKKLVIKHRTGEYPVIIKEHSFKDLKKYIREYGGADKPFFIIDRNVYDNYKEKITSLLSQNPPNNYFIVPAGESSKSYTILNRIHKSLITGKFGRDTAIFAIGGGVTGDLAGFAASTFMRGVKIIHFPTTVISATDSSIGGKTGINFNKVKNVLGTFYQPAAVIIDPLFFNSLPEKVFISGAGELIKYALLSGRKMVDNLSENLQRFESREPRYLEEIIYSCLSFKASVVQQDEMERGLRKILNLGHSFAHAIESASGFKVSHGLAVQAGIISSLFMSRRIGILKGTLDDLLNLCLKIKPDSLVKRLSPQSIFRYMLNDKKNKSNGVNLILLASPGKVIVDFTSDKNDIFASIKDLQDII